jgi:glycosyltransferase involved in cell wall biosynthesis
MCTPTSRRYPRLVRRAIEHGAWVHTPSAFVAAEVCDAFGADPRRVRAVAHGIAPADAGDADAGRKLAVELTGCERYVLALATVEPRKDLPLLVRAFDAVADEVPDVGLVLAGARGWGGAELDAALASAGHRRRIATAGYVDDGLRASLLAGAAVFAFPSRYEGFGLPPLEAMAAGVPVVASDAGAVREVCGDAAALIAVGDADGFGAALLDALDAAPSRIERGRARAATFTWDRATDAMVELYRDCVAEDG